MESCSSGGTAKGTCVNETATTGSAEVTDHRTGEPHIGSSKSLMHAARPTGERRVVVAGKWLGSVIGLHCLKTIAGGGY